MFREIRIPGRPIVQASKFGKGKSTSNSYTRNWKVPRVMISDYLKEEHAKVLYISTKDTWMTLYIRYIANTILLSDSAEAKIVKKNVGSH